MVELKKRRRIRCWCSKCSGETLLHRAALYKHMKKENERLRMLRSGAFSPTPSSASSESEPDFGDDESQGDYHLSGCTLPQSSDASLQADSDEEVAAQTNAKSEEEHFIERPPRFPELEEPAWCDPSRMSLRQLLLVLASFYAKAKPSQEHFSLLLQIIREAAPPNSKIPGTFAEFKALLKDDLLAAKACDVCPKDCVAFAGDYSDLQSCPKCHADRLLANGKPAKQFHYFSVEQWVRQLYANPTIATLLKTHKPEERAADETCFDLFQTQLWSELFATSGPFAGDLRSLALAFVFDGISPFKKKQYSIWPLMIHALNLPPYLRFKKAFTLVWGIIPGKAKPKTLDAYMQILLPEMQLLCDGLKNVVDGSLPLGHADRVFSLKGRFLLYKGDYEGQKLLLNGTGASSIYGCLRCEQESFHCKPLQKRIYASNRRHLPLNAPERRCNNLVFLDKNETLNAPSDYCRVVTDEDRPPPLARTRASILKHMEIAVATGKSSAGFSGKTPLMNLFYFDPTVCMPNDLSHMLNSLVLRLLNLFRRVKPDDGPKVRNLEKELRRNRLSWPRRGKSAPHYSAWNLTVAQRDQADRRRKEISFPVNQDFNRSLPFFTKTSSEINTADTLQAIKYKVLNYCLRDCLLDDQHRAIVSFVDIVGELLRPDTLRVRSSWATRMAKVLVDFEGRLPYSLQVLHMHSLLHAMHGVMVFGSNNVVSNLPSDQIFKDLKRSIHKTHHVELSLLNSLRFSMAGMLAQEDELFPASLWPKTDSVFGIAQFEGAMTSNSSSDSATEATSSSAARSRRSYREMAIAVAGRNVTSFPKLYGRHRIVELSGEHIVLLKNYYASYCPEVAFVEHPSHTVERYDMAWLLDQDSYKVSHYRTQSYEQKLSSKSSFVFQTFREARRRRGTQRNKVPGTSDEWYYLGQIQAFWKHRFSEDAKWTEAALIEWFAPPYFSERDDIWFVNIAEKGTGQTLEPLANLAGHQIVTAHDTAANRLWILQYC